MPAFWHQTHKPLTCYWNNIRKHLWLWYLKFYFVDHEHLTIKRNIDGNHTTELQRGYERPEWDCQGSGSGSATPSLMTWPKFPDLSALVSWSLKWHHTQCFVVPSYGLSWELLVCIMYVQCLHKVGKCASCTPNVCVRASVCACVHCAWHRVSAQ